jgi:hypothetical protein
MEPELDSTLGTDPTERNADLRQSARERTLGANELGKCCRNKMRQVLHDSARRHMRRHHDEGGISLPNLDFLNPDIKTDCANLVVGERYCVLPVVDIK